METENQHIYDVEICTDKKTVPDYLDYLEDQEMDGYHLKAWCVHKKFLHSWWALDDGHYGSPSDMFISRSEKIVDLINMMSELEEDE